MAHTNLYLSDRGEIAEEENRLRVEHTQASVSGCRCVAYLDDRHLLVDDNDTLKILQVLWEDEESWEHTRVPRVLRKDEEYWEIEEDVGVPRVWRVIREHEESMEWRKVGDYQKDRYIAKAFLNVGQKGNVITMGFAESIIADVRVHHVCKARTALAGWNPQRNVACSCGLTIPSKLWWQPNKEAWMFRCRLDWAALIEEGSKEAVRGDIARPVTRWLRPVNKWISNLKRGYGDDFTKWPVIGCDSKFVPFAKGMSTVVEMRLEDGSWTAFAAERMPQELDDAIRGKSAEFHNAYMKLSQDELRSVIPVCFPMTHQIDPEIMPGIARYPVDEWEREGSPCFDTKSWIKLCVKVASQDIENLGGICAIAERIEATL